MRTTTSLVGMLTVLAACAEKPDAVPARTETHDEVTLSDGSRYKGPLKDGKPNGRGTLAGFGQPGGLSGQGLVPISYDGEFKDGAIQTGKMTVGEFKIPRPEGGVGETVPEVTFVGAFKDGWPDGRGVIISHGEFDASRFKKLTSTMPPAASSNSITPRGGGSGPGPISNDAAGEPRPDWVQLHLAEELAPHIKKCFVEAEEAATLLQRLKTSGWEKLGKELPTDPQLRSEIEQLRAAAVLHAFAVGESRKRGESVIAEYAEGGSDVSRARLRLDAACTLPK